MAVRADAKAPPIVAPMNSEGEKIPPDEPEPRLTVVANSLQTNNSASSQAARQLAEYDRLHRRVADAFDVVVAEALPEGRRSGCRPAACPACASRKVA